MKAHQPPCNFEGWETSHLPIFMTLHPSGFGTSVPPSLHLPENRNHLPPDRPDPHQGAGISAAGWGTIACIVVGLALVPFFIADW